MASPPFDQLSPTIDERADLAREILDEEPGRFTVNVDDAGKYVRISAWAGRPYSDDLLDRLEAEACLVVHDSYPAVSRDGMYTRTFGPPRDDVVALAEQQGIDMDTEADR